MRTLQLPDREVSTDELIQLISELDLMPLLVRRYIERKERSEKKPSEEDQVKYQQKFLQREGIDNKETLEAWLKKHNMTEPQLSKRLYNSLQTDMLKKTLFNSQVDQVYLERKSQLDKAMYSLLRTRERPKACELHLRIQDEEDTFADLASVYAEGIEAQVNGLIGPLELGIINPAIAERLRMSKEGQLWEPFEIDGWWVLLRLEKLIPARLDEDMKQRILDDLYENWILSQVKDALQRIVNCQSKNGEEEVRINQSHEVVTSEKQQAKEKNIEGWIKPFFSRKKDE